MLAMHLLDGQLILAGHGLLGLVDGRLVDLDAELTRQLQLGPLVDQLVQHLAGQLAHIGRGPALRGQLLAHALHLGADLQIGDGLGIDHRDDEVGRPRARHQLRRGQ